MRRLFAYLALVTGLAALAAPANASVAETLSCEIGVSAQASSDVSTDASECHHKRKPDTVDDAVPAEQPARKARRFIRPPVLYGVDRAYE